MTSQIDKAPSAPCKERETSIAGDCPIKSIKRLKSPKKTQESKRSTIDVRIEDVFLNSEYFKYHSGNISSLSFCSGDNGENQWKVDSKFEIPLHKTYKSGTVESDTAVLKNEKVTKQWEQKLKKLKEVPQKKPSVFLEGIMSERNRFDRDLISLITEQMFLAERELEITRTHLMETTRKLNERDIEILHLQEKIHNLQKNKGGGKRIDAPAEETEESKKTTEDYQRLMKASEKLKKQVKDMEEFLNDYGLVWVGDKETTEKPDFDKIVKSFHRLNAVANEPKIIQTSVGAKFELPRQIPVVLYSNGLLLRGTDFREYSKVSTSLFLQDVADGYFPSEFQIEFPDGVPFETKTGDEVEKVEGQKTSPDNVANPLPTLPVPHLQTKLLFQVVDKRSEIYKANEQKPTFQGVGNRLGSNFEGKSPTLAYLEPVKKARNDTLYDSPLKKLQKKRCRSAFQRDRNSGRYQEHARTAESRQRPQSPSSDCDANREGLMNVKVRYGKERTEPFLLRVPENENMYVFRRELLKKLCTIYHDDCIASNTDSRNAEFEVHVYGRNPFALSENLNLYPNQLGIVNNSVINISEI